MLTILVYHVGILMLAHHQYTQSASEVDVNVIHFVGAHKLKY